MVYNLTYPQAMQAMWGGAKICMENYKDKSSYMHVGTNYRILDELGRTVDLNAMAFADAGPWGIWEETKDGPHKSFLDAIEAMRKDPDLIYADEHFDYRIQDDTFQVYSHFGWEALNYPQMNVCCVWKKK